MLKNSTILLENGIYYPHKGCGHPGNAANLSIYDTAFMNRISAGGVRILVLSHEDLLYNPKQADFLLETVTKLDISVQLVAFIRPFNEIIFGDFSQHMKQFFEDYLKDRNPYGGNDFESFARLRMEKLKACKNLSAWQKRFSGLPMIIDKHTNIRPVFVDLFEFELDWQLPLREVNRSLRIEDCENIAKVMLNTKISDQDIRVFFEQAFHNTELKDAAKTMDRVKFVETIADDENACLMNKFGLDNKAVME